MGNRPSPYPVAYGNEEELGLYYVVTTPGETQGYPLDGGTLSIALHDYRLHRTRAGARYIGSFGDFGGKEYVDGQHVERASPESPTVEELLPYIQSNERFAIDVGSSALKTIVDKWTEHKDTAIKHVILASNRNVIDGSGVTFGCHDGVGIRELDPEAQKKLVPTLLGHSATRSFVSGAGYSDTKQSSRGLYFAQKVTQLASVSRYGYANSIFRIDRDAHTARVESRCCDVNLSPDATRLRLGSLGMAVAIGQTHLRDWFDKFYYDIGRNRGAWSFAARFNRIPLDNDFNIVYSESIDQAAIYQMKLASAFTSNEMKLYGEQPPELLAIADDLYAYAERMRKVLRGDLHFSVLGDTSDWAAKQLVHQKRLERDRQNGKKRYAGDLITAADDQAYAYRELRYTDDETIQLTKQGYGFTLRDKRAQFRTKLTEGSMDRAMREPPEGGRAKLRSTLIRGYRVSECDWAFCKIDPRYGTERIVIEMPDVSSDKLSGVQAINLASCKRRR
jgi:hypothetical protein